MLDDTRGAQRQLRSGAVRVLVLALLWWVLIEADPAGLWFGAPVVIVATLVSMALLPAESQRWRLGGIIRFAGFFLWQSLLGGFDVALRALHPRLPLDPHFVEYTLRLPPGYAQVLLLNTLSLLPGTLSADVEGRRLLVHALTAGPRTRQNLQRLEALVADVFGVELPPADDRREVRHA